ncbi:MAG: hypothetical protein OEN01_12550 [Candidatus Krumholzibacteria bacterium]|nr:hypothetical protein [Candidatus Krumholzibacteria bacterium]
MKKTLLLTLVVICVAGQASAQTFGGEIWVADSQNLGSCEIAHGNAAPLTQIAIIHNNYSPETLAVGFTATVPALAFLFHTGDVWNFGAVVGGSQAGVNVGYGACLAPGEAIHVGNMNFVAIGAPTGCVAYPITNPSASDCSGTSLGTTFGPGGFVKALPTTDCACGIVPNEDTTWGQIKELFNN